MIRDVSTSLDMTKPANDVVSMTARERSGSDCRQNDPGNVG